MPINKSHVNLFCATLPSALRVDNYWSFVFFLFFVSFKNYYVHACYVLISESFENSYCFIIISSFDLLLVDYVKRAFGGSHE